MENLPADLILPFRIEDRDIRGRLVRLGPVVTEILDRHDYPEGISLLLAHALTLAAMLGASLKFEGKLTLQAKGDGPVNSIVADYKTPGQLRGWVGFDQAAYAAAVRKGVALEREVPQLMGGGYLALTIDQGPDMERYQGIVSLEGGTLAECAQKYFDESEQLPSAIKLCAGKVNGRWNAAGIMVQHLADRRAGKLSAQSEEHWREAAILMASARDDELLDETLPVHQLLFRLFHEQGVRVFEPAPLGVLCQCTREHVAGVLKQFRGGELDDMVVDGKIVVTCEFCNKDFIFDPSLSAA